MATAPTAPTGLFVTDLDGTLATNVTSIVAPEDRAAMARLGTQGVVRVVATGRSLQSTRKVLPPDFPVDYVVFSTGAGIARWIDGKVLVARNLAAPGIQEISKALIAMGADFMAQHPVPDNHHFSWSRKNAANADFARRLSHHGDCCAEWNPAAPPKSVSQFLVIDAIPASAKLHDAIAEKLNGYAVTRATSPLDGQTTWTEIFATGVTKGSGCKWVADFIGLSSWAPRVAVGNDYNDLALLRWASRAFVTADAPKAIQSFGDIVPDAAGGAVRVAISRTFPANP